MNSRMGSDESVEIAKAKTCAIVRAADGVDDQRSRRNLVGAEDFRAIHLALSVEPDQPLAHGFAAGGRHFCSLA